MKGPHRPRVLGPPRRDLGSTSQNLSSSFSLNDHDNSYRMESIDDTRTSNTHSGTIEETKPFEFDAPRWFDFTGNKYEKFKRDISWFIKDTSQDTQIQENFEDDSDSPRSVSSWFEREHPEHEYDFPISNKLEISGHDISFKDGNSFSKHNSLSSTSLSFISPIKQDDIQNRITLLKHKPQRGFHIHNEEKERDSFDLSPILTSRRITNDSGSENSTSSWLNMKNTIEWEESPFSTKADIPYKSSPLRSKPPLRILSPQKQLSTIQSKSTNASRTFQMNTSSKIINKSTKPVKVDDLKEMLAEFNAKVRPNTRRIKQ